MSQPLRVILDEMFPPSEGGAVQIEGDTHYPYGFYSSSPGMYRVDDGDRLKNSILAQAYERDVRISLATHDRYRFLWLQTTIDPHSTIEFDLPPSRVIGSEPGKDSFWGWRLAEPVNAMVYDALTNALARRIGSEFVAVPARGYIRVPETVNHRWPPITVSLKQGDGTMYTLAEIGAALSPSPTNEPESRPDPDPGDPDPDDPDPDDPDPDPDDPDPEPNTPGGPRAPRAPDDPPATPGGSGGDVRARLHEVQELSREPDILAVLRAHARRAGFAGATTVVELVFLILVSRLLARPVSALVLAASSAGKSFAIEAGLRFGPDAAFYALHGMSEKAIVFTEESLEHRILVLYESQGLSGGFMAYGVRSLLSEGHLRYEYTDIERHSTRVVEKEGPTGLIVTATASLDAELTTRLLTFSVPEDEQQTRAVLTVLAEAATGNRRDAEPDHELFQLLQLYIAELDLEVVVPFGPQLAGLVSTTAVRMRRDFSAILSLIQAHALLHQGTRARDDQGRVQATIADYAAAYRLAGDAVAAATERSVSPQIRETVAAVERLSPYKTTGVTTNALAEELGLEVSTVRRRVYAAKERGYLSDQGGGAGRPHRLALGQPLPEDRGALPTPDEIEATCTRAHTSGPAT